MLDADWRRLRRQARQIARKPLFLLLQWVTYHALRPHARKPLDGDLIALVSHDIQRSLDRIADRGVFRFFGILDSSELGPMPIAIVQVTGDGGCVMAVEQVIEAIMAGGRKGQGWLKPEALEVDDLLN